VFLRIVFPHVTFDHYSLGRSLFTDEKRSLQKTNVHYPLTYIDWTTLTTDIQKFIIDIKYNNVHFWVISRSNSTRSYYHFQIG
jgi:hypothetical protein